MTKPETFTPSKELRDYYQRYHRGETDSPLSILHDPTDFDFPCSMNWRDFYEQRYGGLIDFRVSATYAHHYQSIGLMPSLSTEGDQPEVDTKQPHRRDWLSIGMALAEAHDRKKSSIRGVLR